MKWSEVPGATGYMLEEDDCAEFPSPTQVYSGTATQYRISGRPPGTYHYRVKASNAGGESPWSNLEAVSVHARVHLPLILRGYP